MIRNPFLSGSFLISLKVLSGEIKSPLRLSNYFIIITLLLKSILSLRVILDIKDG